MDISEKNETKVMQLLKSDANFRASSTVNV